MIRRVAKQLAACVNRGLTPSEVQRATMIQMTVQGRLFTKDAGSWPPYLEGGGERDGEVERDYAVTDRTKAEATQGYDTVPVHNAIKQSLTEECSNQGSDVDVLFTYCLVGDQLI